MPSTPSFHHLVEEGAHAVGVGAVEQSRVGGDAEAARQRFLDSFQRFLVAAFHAHRKIVVLALPVHVHRERQVLAGLEQVDLFFQQQGVGAQIDIFLARNQSFNNFADLRMQQWLPARDRNRGRAALVHRAEAFFRRELRLQNVRGILNLAAAGTRQVAAEQRLQHQHQRDTACVP